MKKLLAFIALMATAAVTYAQTYAFTNPTYIPTAVGPTTTYSAPGNYVFFNQSGTTLTTRVTGTCTSLAATIQGSNDGSNWTNLNAASIPTGSSTFAISAPGFWRSEINGLTQVRLNITALTASCTVTMAATVSGQVKADPCLDTAIAKSSAIINMPTATTTAIVAAVAGKSIYVCSFDANVNGTSPTVKFEYGTQTTTACDTGTTVLTGTYLLSNTSGALNSNGPTTQFTAPAGNQLCIVTAGTANLQGYLNYVQQ